jgi:hypothetical protein
MSRQLPARPSLEHLRKQAKELLEERRRANPSEQLAVGAATYQVSDDRRVLTISADQQLVVLDRVDDAAV